MFYGFGWVIVDVLLQLVEFFMGIVLFLFVDMLCLEVKSFEKLLEMVKYI